ncbi:MAG: nucleoside-diphosphate kinase [Acidimicrobiales bacterium]
MNRTLVICKPDAVERGLSGEIVGRLERKGLRLVGAELRTIDEGAAGRHYEEHHGKPFYGDLVAFITRSPSLVLVVEGPDDTWRIVRTLMGPTNPADAPPGTIRGDLGTVLTENLIHGSDSAESAAREIAIFFPHLARRRRQHPGSPEGRLVCGDRRGVPLWTDCATRRRISCPSGAPAPDLEPRGRSLSWPTIASFSWAATWRSISAPPTHSCTCEAAASS